MARRINTRFVTIIGLLGGVGLGTIISGPSIKRHFFKPSISAQVAALQSQADDFVKVGQFPEAIEVITAACQRDPDSRDLCLRRGDILMLAADDGDATLIDSARTSWENALAIDHTCKPAVQRLFDSYIEELNARPTPAVCIHLHDAASRLLILDPANNRAKAYIEIATIQQWVGGMPMRPEQSDQAIARLAKIQRRDPSAGDLLLHLVRGMVFKSTSDSQLLQSSESSDTQNICRQLLSKASASFPTDPELNFRIFQGCVILLDAEHDAERVSRDRVAADLAIRRVRELVKDDDTRYADYQYVASEWARRNGHLDESEKILRALFATRKSDPHARLALAKILALTGNPAKRDEAIAILDQPFTQSRQGAFNSIALAELKGETLLELTLLRIAQISGVESTRRPALLAQIESDYATIQKSASVDAIPVLRLGGLIAQLKGQNVQAVQLLSRAMTLLEHSQANSEIKFDLMYQLATTQRLLGQDASAKRLLIPIVDRFDTFTPARIQLAELLLSENNLDEAGRHIHILAQQSPQDEDVVRLRARLAFQQGDPTAARNLGALLHSPQDSAPAVSTLNDDQFSTEVRLAQLALRENKLMQALKSTQAADRIRPNDPNVWDLFFNIAIKEQDWKMAGQAVETLAHLNADQADGKMYRWKLCMARRQFVDAIATATDLTTSRENFGQSWIMLAQAYQANGQFEEAIQKYQAALERQTTNIDIYRGVAECYTQLSEPDRAVESIRQGIALVPTGNRLQAIHLAAEYYESAGQFTIAEQLYRDCIHLTPGDPQTLNNFAYLLAEDLHRPVEARQFSQQAYDISLASVSKRNDPNRRPPLKYAQEADSSPSDPAHRYSSETGVSVLSQNQEQHDVALMIADTHGWVLTLCGGIDADEGFTILDGLVRNHPDCLDARYHLAMAYLMRNRPADAITQLDAATDQIRVMDARHENINPQLKISVQAAMGKARQAVATQASS